MLNTGRRRCGLPDVDHDGVQVLLLLHSHERARVADLLLAGLPAARGCPCAVQHLHALHLISQRELSDSHSDAHRGAESARHLQKHGRICEQLRRCPARTVNSGGPGWGAHSATHPLQSSGRSRQQHHIMHQLPSAEAREELHSRCSSRERVWWLMGEHTSARRS